LCFEEKEIVLKAKKKNQKKKECHADYKIRKKKINNKND
jgi:aminoglycoside phosphotransferase family enzyme